MMSFLLVAFLKKQIFEHFFQFYMELCAPFRLEKSDMSLVLSCMREIKTIKAGNDYVTEKMSPADSLSLVLSGR